MLRSPGIVVIGAGIGGLTTAALLAQAGHEVTVLEANTYPGGCAGTFTHRGYRFDAGATLAGGFHDSGPHAILGEQLNMTWPVRRSHQAWAVHMPDRHVLLSRDHSDLIAQFPRSRSFWREQEALSDLSWLLSAQGLPWPPTSGAELKQLLATSLAHFPGVIRLLPALFSTTRHWMGRHGLADDAEFTRLIDALLLISAQTTSRRANALYSATALDLPRQGVVHVQGGMGGIAQTLVDKLAAFGGRIQYRRKVTGIQVCEGRVRGVYVQAGKRDGERELIPAGFVVANLTPASLAGLLGTGCPARLHREALQQQSGWGAFVLHLGVESAKLPELGGDHHQIVTQMEGSLGEGRSIFVSISPQWDTSRAPAGHQAVTVSTHTEVNPWWELLDSDPDRYEQRKQVYAEQILAGVDAYLPGFRRSVSLVLPGTPITYHHYTGRHRGLVGGIPQTSLFRARGPRTGIPNLRLVGDSIFPGQSTAGVTLGGMRVAQDILRRLSHGTAANAGYGSPVQTSI